MSSDSTPTPKLTGQFAYWRDAAQGIYDELCTLELTLTKDLRTYDRSRAELARSAARLAAHYVQAFDRWNREPVPLEHKQRDQDEFKDLVHYAQRLLGRAPAP